MDIREMQPLQKGQKVHELVQEAPGTYYYLFVSDVHIDSPNCNLKLLKSHFNEAKAKDAKIFINGDLFDVMGGRYDPRRSPSNVLPEIYEKMHNGAAYLTAVIEYAADFLEPYAHNILLISLGNHETSIHKNCDVDLIGGLTTLLHARTGANIMKGGYEGYLSLRYKRKTAPQTSRLLIKYHHGYGGNPSRSKGILQDQINAMKWPSADIIVTGHLHFKSVTYEVMETINTTGVIELKKQRHVRTGSYKEKKTGAGWEVEKGFPHLPQGGYWLEVKAKHTSGYIKPEPRFYEAG